MIFRFKKFAVSHAGSSMRVGTDAVLLGAWAEINNAENILDVGTGSGIIALMLAQRNENAKIKAIDIHPGSVVEATKNFETSPWQNRLDAEFISLQQFTEPRANAFDHIISNPPFFSKSTPAPDKIRHQARHTDTLSPDEFFGSCKKLLTENGKISLILPYNNFAKWVEAAANYQLFPSGITHVLSYPNKPVERILIEFSNSKQTVEPKIFYIRKGKGLGYSEEYIELTKEFYL